MLGDDSGPAWVTFFAPGPISQASHMTRPFGPVSAVLSRQRLNSGASRAYSTHKMEWQVPIPSSAESCVLKSLVVGSSATMITRPSNSACSHLLTRPKALAAADLNTFKEAEINHTIKSAPGHQTCNSSRCSTSLQSTRSCRLPSSTPDLCHLVLQVRPGPACCSALDTPYVSSCCRIYSNRHSPYLSHSLLHTPSAPSGCISHAVTRLQPDHAFTCPLPHGPTTCSGTMLTHASRLQASSRSHLAGGLHGPVVRSTIRRTPIVRVKATAMASPTTSDVPVADKLAAQWYNQVATTLKADREYFQLNTVRIWVVKLGALWCLLPAACPTVSTTCVGLPCGLERFEHA